MKKIGINSLGYNQVRNIAGLPFTNYQVKKIFDIYKIPTHLYFKLKNYSHQYFLNSFNDFGLNNVDILHFFNAVNYTKKPWLTTSEHIVPRYFSNNEKRNLNGLNSLIKPNFKKLILMSNAAQNNQLSYLRDNFSEHYENIKSKMCVLLPSQKQQINNINEKATDENFLVFTVVASNGFFRKGGREILAAFDHLLEKKYQLKLNLISNFDYGDYASKTTIHDHSLAMKTIEKHSKNISTFNHIPNEKVLQLFKNTNVGLLPTYADTFGYSILESQASGCPVISTNIFAIPEINNNTLGWIIDVPKYENGNGKIKTEQERQIFSNTIKDGLISLIEDIYLNPQQIKPKAEAALQNIVTNHNPINNANKLEFFYNQILEGKL